VKAAANLSMFDFLNLAWKQKEAIEEVRSARLAMLQDYANDARSGGPSIRKCRKRLSLCSPDWSGSSATRDACRTIVLTW